MKRIVLVIAAFLSLTACSTQEKVSDVDAQAADSVGTNERVTLRRMDGREDIVTITHVGTDAMTIRHDNGESEVLAYSAIDSLEYSRADATINTLMLSVALAFFVLGLTGYLEENMGLFPAAS